MLAISPIFPATYLQGTLNKIGNPEYIKYGATGFVLGHEFYHVMNSKSDDLYEYSWDDPSREIFSRQDGCLINQYSNYSLGSTKVDANKSLLENIADNGGIKAAYLAYSDWALMKNEPESLLPNLPYTPKQMFWISVVNNFCEKKKDPNSYDPRSIHAPSEVRIPGAFSNLPEFAKDFNCSVGSRMNPTEKCSV